MGSRNNTLRPSSSASWLGSLATTGPDLRFSTFGAGSPKPSPRRKIGAALVEEDVPAGIGRASVEDELRELRGLEAGAEQGWSVTVAEGPKARSRSRKPDPTLTVYVSTPTSSLTLTRKASELVDLEARLRAQFPGRLPAGKPLRAPPTPKKRNTVLASLTRTLSPRRGESKSSISSSSAFAGSKAASSSASTGAAALQALSATLSTASLDTTIRAHAAWDKFFAVRRDDLESARVERRIKRARSDQTMHLAPVPAPAPSASAAATSLSAQAAARDERQEPSAASAATEELVDSVEDDEAGVLNITCDAAVKLADDKDKTAPPEEDIELDAASGRREGSGESAQAEAMEVSVELVPQQQESEPAATSEVNPSVEGAIMPVVTAPEPASDLEKEEDATPAAHEPIHRRGASAPPSSLAPSSSVSTSASMTRSSSNMSAATTITRASRTITLDSFDVLRVLGKGCAGKVLLVRRKGTKEYYALKAITKRHVLAHRELAHTRTEQAILKKCAKDLANPFVVKLHYSFHDHDTLYLALDFHPGGDLATQLARWGRLGRDRARFYICEIIDGVAGLHRAGIIYRDLKPENVLISANGHVVLTDFGLSKYFEGASPASDPPRPHWLGHLASHTSTPPGLRAYLHEMALTTPETSPYFTSTFCGTSEYLAPEVLLGQPYTFSVDWFSAGTLLYEMLAGITPFYADDHPTMYRRVLQDELTFDEAPQCFDDDTKSLLRGMLQRNPSLRITHSRMVRHPYFSMITWAFIREKRYVPPFVPTLNPDDPADLSQFDDMFLSLPAEVKGDDPSQEAGGERDPPTGEPQAAVDEAGRDVFDGYSYCGRDSASIHRQEMLDDADGLEVGSVVSEPRSVAADDAVEGAAAEATSTAEVVEGATGMEPVEPASVSKAASVPVDDEPGAVEEAKVAPLEEGPDRLLSSTPPIRTTSPVQIEGEEDGPSSDADVTATSSAIAESTPDAPVDQLAVVRPRHTSSRSNLESLPEEQPRKAASTTTTDVVVEDPDEDLSDSEWDLVDRAADIGGFVRNGGREATLWQRGFRDRYRLVLAPLASPLRPPLSGRRMSSQPPRAVTGGPSASSRSSLHVSPVATPEPPSPRPSAMRRLTSIRSSTSGKGSRGGTLRPKESLDAGLYASANGLVTTSAPVSPGIGARASKQSLALSTTSSQPAGGEVDVASPAATPRKAGQAIRKFAKSAFLSTTSNKA